jgi:hypothetical protein
MLEIVFTVSSVKVAIPQWVGGKVDTKTIFCG